MVARRFAAALPALGLRREERVLLLMPDTVDWPVVFLGCLYAGVVPVAVNTLLTAADYAYVLAHSRAQVAFVSSALAPVLRAAMRTTAHEVERVIEPAEIGAVIDQHAQADSAADTAADDIGFWLYSSGSTGRPKGTVHTHGNLYWTAELYGKPVLGVRESDVVFSAAKLFFAYGLGNALTFPLSVGASVVLMAERWEIRTDCCSPTTRSSGLARATASSHALVASRRSRELVFVTPNSTPCVKSVCPSS